MTGKKKIRKLLGTQIVKKMCWLRWAEKRVEIEHIDNKRIKFWRWSLNTQKPRR